MIKTQKLVSFSNPAIPPPEVNPSLVFLSCVLLRLEGVNANLLVVLLESSHVFASLRELSFLHALANVPVDECPLGVHQVKLVVQPGPSLRYCCRVAEHADSSLNLGKVATRNHSWRLVVDPNLEASWAPVNKLDRPLRLYRGNRSVHVLGHDVAPVEHAAGHVLAVAGVALHHLVGRLEAGVRDLGHAQLLVVSFF